MQATENTTQEIIKLIKDSLEELEATGFTRDKISPKAYDRKYVIEDPDTIQAKELNGYIFTERILNVNNNKKIKTLDEIASPLGLTRERIRQKESKIVEKVKTEFQNINDSLLQIAEVHSMFDSKKIFFVEPKILNQLSRYKNLIIKYWNKDNIENLCFDINYEKNLFYKDIDFNYIQETAISVLQEGYYSFAQIEELLSTIIINKTSGQIDNETLDILTVLVIRAFLEKYSNNLFNLADSIENGVFAYYKNSISNSEKEKIKLLYWFKTVYPNGVYLPQAIGDNDEKQIKGIKNLQPLFNKCPSISSLSYRSITSNKITAEDDIVIYDTGHYIHIDYFKEIYQYNKEYVDNLCNLICNLFRDDYDLIPFRLIFVCLENEFINAGIKTFEILFHILEQSTSTNLEFKYGNRKELIISDEKGINIRRDNPFLEKEKQEIKDFILHNEFNSTVDFNLGEDYVEPIQKHIVDNHIINVQQNEIKEPVIEKPIIKEQIINDVIIDEPVKETKEPKPKTKRQSKQKTDNKANNKINNSFIMKYSKDKSEANSSDMKYLKIGLIIVGIIVLACLIFKYCL